MYPPRMIVVLHFFGIMVIYNLKNINIPKNLYYFNKIIDGFPETYRYHKINLS